MQYRPLKFRLMASAIVALLCQLAAASLVTAQNDSLVDDRQPVKIKRVAKRGHVHRAPKKVVRRGKRQVVVPDDEEVAPLLSLQWRLFKVKPDGTQEETNPIGKFYPGDFLRLAVKTNQSGYLYIVHQSAKDGDGQIIFPDSRVNGGRNYVNKNQEFVLPSNCPAGANNGLPCAFPVMPPAGQEFFTLIFSRDQLEDFMPNKLMQTAGVVKPEVLQRLMSDTGQRLIHGSGDGLYSVKVVNNNTRDNEDIIEMLVLNKGVQ